MNNNYIIISSIDWKTSWQTQHRLAKSLIDSGDKVLFIENTGLRNIKFKDKNRIISRLKTWKKSTKGFNQVEKNLFIYSPIIFPAPYNKIISYLNAKNIYKNIKKWMDTFYFDNPIVVNFLPTALNNKLLELINPNLNIYYAANDFGTQSGTEKIIKSEIITIKTANLNFATSHQILDKLKKYSKSNFFFPASIEEKKFNNIKGEKPQIFNKIKSPIVSYLGNFTEVFDIDLILDLIKNSQELSFLFIGDLKLYNKKFEKLNKFKNCYFTGEVPNNLVPLYLKHVDIGIVPYFVNDFTNGVYSSKLNEYLAVGLPVISTKFREMKIIEKNNQNLIYLIENNFLDFKNKIKIALSEKNKLKKFRVDYSFNNSWDKKFKQIQNLINNHLEIKNIIKHDWKKVYLKNVRNYTTKVIFGSLLFYLLLFKSPFIDLIGSKLILKNKFNNSSKTILVMSGYGSDNYINNSYLLIAKKLNNLIKENNKNDIYFIISGRFQIYPESQIIKQFLLTSGVKKQNIITIDSQYKNTYENLSLLFQEVDLNSKKKDTKFTILTSPYHSQRVSLILKKKFPNYNLNIITSDKLKISQYSKIKIVTYEYLAIFYNFLKGNI
jgi:glycosyltransferase involved in cell wall biosynthesis/uncharacterized SAM-binding protein YcdF (DUF218 family)